MNSTIRTASANDADARTLADASEYSPQPPMSIFHLMLLTAGVALAVRTSDADWRYFRWSDTVIWFDVAIEGLCYGVAALGLLRLGERIVRPDAPRYRTLPGHALAFFTAANVTIARTGTQLLKPALLGLLGMDFLDTRIETGVWLSLSILSVAAAERFRRSVSSTWGWHLVGIGVLGVNIMSAGSMALTFLYHQSGFTPFRLLPDAILSPQVIGGSFAGLTLLLTLVLIGERFAQKSDRDWLHTTVSLLAIVWYTVSAVRFTAGHF